MVGSGDRVKEVLGSRGDRKRVRGEGGGQRMGNRNGKVTGLDQGDREREEKELEGVTRKGDGERR